MIPPPPPKAPPATDPRADDPNAARARELAGPAFASGLEIAWQRIAADDLRGAELELDELRATYELAPFQEMTAYDVYGYIFTRYLDYGRAIAAYESGFSVADRVGGVTAAQVRWSQLADLYFARHQYDMALKTVLRYQATLDALGRDDRDTTAYIEKLRALGVTEETL
jgi:tetratricopeptide (TPR) repeat protein